MKTLKGFVFIVLTAVAFVLPSCDEDDNKPSGEFASGTFVVNEGNFLDADGTVSFISPADGSVKQDVFGSVNDGLALGDVVQSMTIVGDYSYIVVNNSNKIEVVDANTFEAVHTIDGLSLPRYFTTLNGKGYVTEWVGFTDPGRVTIIEGDDHIPGASVTTGYGTECIIALDGKLYVSNNFSNTVSVIDPGSFEVIKTIDVGSAPGSLLVDSDNMIWVVCGGGFDMDYNPLNDGKLVRIDPAQSDDPLSNSVVKTIELGMNLPYPAKAAINKSLDKIAYYNNKSVYLVNTSATDPPAEALFTESSATSFYGIGIDPETDLLYLADSKSFAGNGKVFRYDLSGNAVDNMVVGRGPNGFVFKKK